MRIRKISRNMLAVWLTLFSVILFASKPTSNHANTIPDAIYTEDQLNIAINASHSEFILKLKSNPTTGYAWFLREYDPTLIVPVKRTFESPEKELIGAAGYELWTFRVKPNGFVVPQQTTIRMIYARPWQGNDSSTQLVFWVTTTP